MLSHSTADSNKSFGPSSPLRDAQRDAECTKRLPVPEPPYKPYADASAVTEVPYRPYADASALGEAPYRPYDDSSELAKPAYEPYKGI
jgi:hypothetical protein